MVWRNPNVAALDKNAGQGAGADQVRREFLSFASVPAGTAELCYIFYPGVLPLRKLGRR